MTSSPLFELTTPKGVSAEAREVNGDFIVLKDSHARREDTPSLRLTHRNQRSQLRQERKLCEDKKNDSLIFMEDVPFASPSAAASVITGSSSNGYISWKVKGSSQTYGEWQRSRIKDNTIEDNPLNIDSAVTSSPLFELTLPGGASAEAKKVNGDFIILKGSHARREHTRSLKQTYRKQRSQLCKKGKLCEDEQGKFLIFMQDVSFSSPSAAASVITGTSSNGYISWKVKGSSQTYGNWQRSQDDTVKG